MVKSDSIVGLGTGSTTAYAIQYIGERLKSGELQNIVGVPTSFQAGGLSEGVWYPPYHPRCYRPYDIAIDGADEVDPHKNLIKGGGAAHTREKVVDYLANQFIVVVDAGKMVEKLGSVFAVPVEVIPMAITPVMNTIKKMGGKPELRMGVKKAGPVITDQGNMVVDVTFDSIPDPVNLEITLNNIPGVLENGIFVNCVDIVLIGEVKDGQPIVRQI
ncbi:MAG: ribose-5-phosphate isomerase RpiA [Calothrix sp. SM1_7_51]|nr:ribose-5-phosphate isomerase RpiA [Calothrix sp. SM1_7_51]